ncbi:MAG TPA: YCF48-related protein, partial [bacterium]|nr:YCF48-related protein [bacterium]
MRILLVPIIMLLIVSCANNASDKEGWRKIQSGTTDVLLGISMPSQTTGYIVGTNGRILKTTNGGNDWSSQTSGTTSFLRDVHFINDSLGVAVGESGKILYTDDGGEHWNVKVSNTTSHLV